MQESPTYESTVNLPRLIAGLVVVAGFFIPFFDLRLITISGWEILRSIFRLAQASSGFDFGQITEIGFSESSSEGIVAGIAFLVILLGPILIGIHGVLHVVRSLTGSAKGGHGAGFAILYLVVSIVFFWALSDDIGLPFSFFDVAGTGVYLSLPALLVAHVFSGEEAMV